MRRTLWLGAGVAAGVSGTVWVRRRLATLSRRVRPGSVADQVTSVARAVPGALSGRVRHAVEGGRADARRREAQLRRRFGLAPEDLADRSELLELVE